MKRLDDATEKETGLMDLPLDIQAEILLMFFEYKISSMERWHRLQQIFRMIPQFGRTEVKPLFYAKVQYITPDLYMEFYKTMEYPLFLGLREFSPTSYTEEAHFALVPLLKNLQTLDISSCSLPGGIGSLTNLTSLTCSFNTKDEDLVNMTQLTTLKISGLFGSLGNETFSRLTNLTNLDINSGFVGNTELTPVIFNNLPYLKTLAFKLFASGTFRPEVLRDYFDSVTTEFANLTSLHYEGPLAVVRNMIGNLPNLVELCLSDATNTYPHYSGYFSNLFNLTKLSLLRYHYHFDDNDLNGLTKLSTLSIEDCRSFDGIQNLTSITNLSIKHKTDIVLCDYTLLVNLKKLSTLAFHVPYKLTDSFVSMMEGLTYLDVIGNSNITDRSLLKLTNLKRLDLAGYSPKLSRNAINRLPNLGVVGVPAKEIYGRKRLVESLDNPNVKLLEL